MQSWPIYALEWVLVVFIALVALIILYKMLLDKINLSTVLNEMTPVGSPGAPAPGGATPATAYQPKASLSRLQLLIFTFVIAGLYLALSLQAGQLVPIPNGVLGLLGISGGSFVVSKGIQANAGAS
jgi:hypothetical protein